VISGLLTGLVFGLAALVLLPVAIGWRPYTVLTGSMRPRIQPGDVVMDKPILATQIHVGKVVTFKDMEREGKLVTHRVRSVSRQGNMVSVETRGDANNTSEHWSVAADGHVGQVMYTLPMVGRIGHAIRNPIGILILVIVPCFIVAAQALRKIWMAEEPAKDAPAGASPPQDAAEPEAANASLPAAPQRS